MKFRKKPVEIEAFGTSELLTAAKEDWPALPACIRKAYELGNLLFLPDAVEIRTLEGTMRADRADWIIEGVQGELYPCKPDIFFATYGPAEVLGHNPHNVEDESFNSPGHMGAPSTHAQACDWLRANGINPAHVAGDARATMVDGEVTLIMKVQGPNGHDVIDPEGTGVLKETKTFPVTVPPPPLVEVWLAPKCPTCGR